MENQIKPLFIVPARGGSKGIPYKNIVELNGRPLIDYTLQVALTLADDSRRIIVSTDDDKIAATAERCGVPVWYRRPPELATDTASSRDVVLDAMNRADEVGIEYDAVVLLQPTSPLRSVADVQTAMDMYKPDVDMVVTVTEASANPYYNCFEMSTEGCLEISKGDGRLTRRQDAPRAYEFNGAVYVINPRSIRRQAMGEFKRRIPAVMPRERSVDIDTPFDLAVAEALLQWQATKPLG